jgi:drug/metabolite transporter (DMT)-like permease
MSWVGAGLLLGTAAAWPVRTVLNSFLYRSSVSDAGVWIATLFLLVFTTGLSAYVLAVRASSTNLTDALKID